VRIKKTKFFTPIEWQFFFSNLSLMRMSICSRNTLFSDLNERGNMKKKCFFHTRTHTQGTAEKEGMKSKKKGRDDCPQIIIKKENRTLTRERDLQNMYNAIISSLFMLGILCI